MSSQVSDAVALKLAQESEERLKREHDDKMKKAQRFRFDYLLKLNDLGLHERVILQYGAQALSPRIQVVPIEGNDRLQARQAIEDQIAALTGIHLAGAGIVGVDGATL